MDELIELVSQRTGISAEKAQMAVQTVLGFMKDKLPAPIAAQLDGLMSGGGGVEGAMGGLDTLAKTFGGIFGKQA